jgi:hypothetical protein
LAGFRVVPPVVGQPAKGLAEQQHERDRGERRGDQRRGHQQQRLALGDRR